MPQQTTVFAPALKGLNRPEWHAALARLGESKGFYELLGSFHDAVFVDRGDILLVSFESAGRIRAKPASGNPLSFELTTRAGWSSLTVLCEGETWFRAPEVYDFFDALTDDGFFDAFETVVFFGAGPAGYAAGAFSVASPGARVVMVHPQATLNPKIAGWDDRFRAYRSLDFTSRYGYAPEMVEAAHQAHVVYDPYVASDAMHAALFAKANVALHPLAFFGDALIDDLAAMGGVPYLLHAAATDRLTPRAFSRLARKRRNYLPYLRRLLAHLESAERYALAAQLCRYQMSRRKAPHFARRLKLIEETMISSDGSRAA
jgi:hypothetical protein